MANEKRLIDANALLARLASSSESWAKNIKAIRNWWPHAVGIKDNIVGVINDMPTVDAVEVVHGHWIYEPVEFTYEKDIKCSICGSYVEYATNYCPNCGADMRERKDK